MSKYDLVQEELRKYPKRWLITGVAGFIGSNLLETLLKLEQSVVGLDNFATGHRRNLDEVKGVVSPEQWSRFSFIEGDICNLTDCRAAVAPHGQPVDYILHQAALGSVPRSIADPIATNRANIDGFLNMLVVARDFKVHRFIYAASSSTYGDHPALPKVEDIIGRLLSPYAVTKYVNELYADVFARTYGLDSIGLRYFNVFGKRQDPNGAYAAVIPRWIAAMIQRREVGINGDGETSRDFCYIENVVEANILAATTVGSDAVNEVYNIAVGERTTLNQLFGVLRSQLLLHAPTSLIAQPQYRAFREGDVRHSLACIEKARARLGYLPTFRMQEGIAQAMPWYITNVQAS